MPTMSKQPVGGFAELLQRLRVNAGLTQEKLAAAAEVSPRTISDLERGINRTARKDTAGLLADAMALTGDERAEFLAVASGKPAPAEASGYDDADASNLGWLDSAVSKNFVGRQKELGFLRCARSRVWRWRPSSPRRPARSGPRPGSARRSGTPR